jgi:hypothetical protein
MWETAAQTTLTIVLPLLSGYFIAAAGHGRRLRNLEYDVHQSAEERKLVLKSLLACLYGLQEHGCNGPVTDGIAVLETWLNDIAHAVKSGDRSGL